MPPVAPLHGIFTALATPFTKDGELDEAAYASHIESQIQAGIHGLVPVGTTGESPTLNVEEHQQVLKLCIETAAGRVPVIAGAGGNSTAEAIALTRFAASQGATATLQITPYYNKPTQQGLLAHFKAISQAVDLPIILYNVPARTSVSLSIETTIELARSCPNIIGLKDAEPNDITRASHIARANLSKNFCLLSGEDASLCAFLAMGGHGCISVASNVVPQPMLSLYESFASGNLERMAALRNKLLPLWSALFCETSPSPLKYAMFLQKTISSPHVRLPLVEASETAKNRIREALDIANHP